MNQAYINAYLYIEPMIYGKKLLPLSLGHALILDFISSPFFSGGEINENDLLTAIFFCSIDFETGKHCLSNQQIRNELLKQWAKDNKGKYDYQTELEAFQVYLKYYMTFPRRWENESGNKDNKVPWQVSILWLMMDKVSEKEALDMPLTKCMAYVACHSNENGESNLAGVMETELLDRWEEEEKDIKENING